MAFLIFLGLVALYIIWATLEELRYEARKRKDSSGTGTGRSMRKPTDIS